MLKKPSIRIAATLSVILALIIAIGGCAGSPTSTTTNTTTTSAAATTTTTSKPVPTPANPQVILASTTSTRDSGLMDVLTPLFQQQTGYVLKPVYVGSGAAITQAQKGDADVLLVHSPAAEVKAMASGGLINRRLVMHNDFILVGPASDPAGIKGSATAVDALKKIAATGAAFYSRGDASGTDSLEKSLWAKAGVTVADGSANNPKWYVEGGAGSGMLDLLRIADAKGGYTITDRATYVANAKIIALAILVQGDPALLNIYHVIQVDPAKYPAVNAAGAQAFADFMVSPATQQIISQYGIAQYGQALFFPDAGKTEAQLGSQ